MPYLLAAVAVVMPIALIASVVRGRVRVQCCAVIPPPNEKATD